MVMTVFTKSDHSLRKKFLSIPREEYLSIDEQLYPSKAMALIRQYTPLKPKKWGYKVYSLASMSGFEYDFEVYTGLENDPNQRFLYNGPDLRASSNTVIRLRRTITPHVYRTLLYDNYFTSLQLGVHIYQKGILTLGTVDRNRLPGLKLPLKPNLKKLKRGESKKCVAQSDGASLNVHTVDG